MAVRNLQPQGQVDGIAGSRKEGQESWYSKPLSPQQTPQPTSIRLKLRVEQTQTLPALQGRQSVWPGLAIEQQFQFHSQPGAKSRWSRSGIIPELPRPWPCSKGCNGLKTTLRCKLETQSGGVASRPQQSRWIILNTAPMKEPKLATLKITLASIGIDQSRVICERESHGIHREVTASQIIFQATGLH